MPFDISATFIVVGGTRAVNLRPSTPSTQPASVVIGGMTVNLDQIATQLDPGEVIVVNDILVSLDASGSNLVIGGTQTIPLLEVTQILGASVVVVDGTTVNVSEIATQLDPGETTVIGTMPISLDTSALIAGSMTIPLAANLGDMVLGGTTIIAGALPSGFSFVFATAGGGLLLPNGQTLIPVVMTTIHDIEISPTPGETPVAVIGSSISFTATDTVSNTDGNPNNDGTLRIGWPTRTSTSELVQFTGGAVAATKEVHNILWISAIASSLLGALCSWV